MATSIPPQSSYLSRIDRLLPRCDAMQRGVRPAPRLELELTPMFAIDNTGLGLDTIAHIIQVALTPVFFLTGIATLLNVFSTRLGRVSDRVHYSQ